MQWRRLIRSVNGPQALLLPLVLIPSLWVGGCGESASCLNPQPSLPCAPSLEPTAGAGGNPNPPLGVGGTSAGLGTTGGSATGGTPGSGGLPPAGGQAAGGMPVDGMGGQPGAGGEAPGEGGAGAGGESPGQGGAGGEGGSGEGGEGGSGEGGVTG